MTKGEEEEQKKSLHNVNLGRHWRTSKELLLFLKSKPDGERGFSDGRGGRKDGAFITIDEPAGTTGICLKPQAISVIVVNDVITS